MEVALRCQVLFKYKRPDDSASSNMTPNVNEKWLRKCVSMNVRGLLSDQTCEFRVLVILSMLNLASSKQFCQQPQNSQFSIMTDF
jgi:hypothetical protein